MVRILVRRFAARRMNTQVEAPKIVRSRISEKLAFPVGYELLRTHFAQSLPWADARFTFSAHPTTFASEFTRILREGQPYLVLRIERRAASEAPVAQSAHWHFTIYPVLRDLKSFSRSALLSSAFPHIQHFLSHAPTHWSYYNRVDAIFDPAEKTCRVEQLRDL